MTSATVSPPLTWVVVYPRCRVCDKPQATTVEKQPGIAVRITFRCDSRRCGEMQRQTL